MKLFFITIHISICILLVESAKKTNICKGKPRDSIFKHPLGCKHYISCEKGVPNTGVCEEGMLYSAIKPPCVDEAESECEDSTRQTTQSTMSTETETVPTRRTTRSRTTRLRTTTEPTTPITSATIPSTTSTTTSTTTTPTTELTEVTEDALTQLFPWLATPSPTTTEKSSSFFEAPAPSSSPLAPPTLGPPTLGPPTLGPPMPELPATTELSTSTELNNPPTPPQISSTTKKRRRKTTTPKTTTTAVPILEAEEEEVEEETETTVEITTSTTSTTTTESTTTTTTTATTQTTSMETAASHPFSDFFTPTLITETISESTETTPNSTLSSAIAEISEHSSVPNANTTHIESTMTFESSTQIERGISCPNADNVTSITFRSSNINCSRYYICYHGHPMAMNCPTDLHWNSVTEKCELPESAKCNITTSFPSEFPICPRTEIKFFAHPQSCSWFLYCNRGHMTVQQCPYAYHWDYEQDKCLEKNIAKCAINVDDFGKKKGKTN